MRQVALIIVCIAIVCLASSGCASSPAVPAEPDMAATGRQPVIDMHRHAAWLDQNDAERLESTLDDMDDNNVVLAVIGIPQYEDVATYIVPHPDRFIGGVETTCPRETAGGRWTCFENGGGVADLSWLRREVAAGHIGAIHEIGNIYAGLPPGDSKLEPYWTLAEELDLPAGIHIGRGPPPDSPFRPTGCCPEFDSAMGNPALLRPVLDKHPKLRLWLEHVGAGDGIPGIPPYTEETMALLRDYPNVYLDMTITSFVMTPEIYEKHLRMLIDAGFGDRIMFGSDGLPIGPQLARLAAIDWLSDAQRRGILYDNAARFLRLPPDRIDRDYGRVPAH